MGQWVRGLVHLYMCVRSASELTTCFTFPLSVKILAANRSVFENMNNDKDVCDSAADLRGSGGCEFDMSTLGMGGKSQHLGFFFYLYLILGGIHLEIVNIFFLLFFFFLQSIDEFLDHFWAEREQERKIFSQDSNIYLALKLFS